MTIIEETYKKHMNLKLAANELGMPWQTLYVRLKKEGVPVVGDKARYGSDKDKLAKLSEDEFLRFVPDATNMNELEYQSKVDFWVGNVSVDVKSSKPYQKNKHITNKLFWSFSVQKQSFDSDFVCCFCFEHDNKLFNILLIPSEIFSGYKTITVPYKRKSKWNDYVINGKELKKFFEDINGSNEAR